MIKNFIYVLCIIAIFLNIFLIWTVSVEDQGPYNIQTANYAIFKETLDGLFQDLAQETSADLVWLNLIHESEDAIWIAPFRENSIPLYQSAIHYWTQEGIPNPIKNRQKEPLLVVERINETLRGRCLGRITGIDNHHDPAGLPIERLIIRCPLENGTGRVVGTYGITILEFQSDNIAEDISRYINLVRLFGPSFEEVLFDD